MLPFPNAGGGAATNSPNQASPGNNGNTSAGSVTGGGTLQIQGPPQHLVNSGGSLTVGGMNVNAIGGANAAAVAAAVAAAAAQSNLPLPPARSPPGGVNNRPNSRSSTGKPMD